MNVGALLFAVPLVLMTLLFCAAAMVVGGAFVFAAYLVALRRAALAAFLRLEAELDRRYNLGLRLIRATQEHLPHADAPLEALVDARGLATQTALAAFLQPEQPDLVRDLVRADEAYGQALNAYAAHLRRFPAAGDPDVVALLRSLSETHRRVGPAEEAYNEAVEAYNAFRIAVPRRITTETLPVRLPAFQFRAAPLRVLAPVAVSAAA